jgi:23S rRNA (cytosine1962-C5)-methyltransferase
MVFDWAETLPKLLETTLQPRLPLVETNSHEGAYRLFNGFTEGFPSLSVDLYGRTIVLFAHKIIGNEATALAKYACDFYTQSLPWVDCVIAKQRSDRNEALKRGKIISGTNPASNVVENDIRYAVDLLMNQDASFYIDTRNLRGWLKRRAVDREILNTFAYTGSMGVAALAGGAKRVLQIDRSAKFLNLAQRSAELNHLDLSKISSKTVDFFVAVGQLKQRQELFDIIILDPPYFSITEKGRVDLAAESGRLINKVRPLLRDGGYLVVVNNALYLSGHDFIASLEELGKDGYLTLEERIDIPQDFTGYEDTQVLHPPTDPAPFNHPTKIAVLSVRRK